MADTLRQTVAISNPQGFHMRPMAAFVEAANRFPSCTVTVTRAGKPPVNGRSILGLMGLVADQGTELMIEVCGDSAADALAALAEIFERNFDEEEESSRV